VSDADDRFGQWPGSLGGQRAKQRRDDAGLIVFQMTAGPCRRRLDHPGFGCVASRLRAVACRPANDAGIPDDILRDRQPFFERNHRRPAGCRRARLRDSGHRRVMRDKQRRGLLGWRRDDYRIECTGGDGIDEPQSVDSTQRVD